MSLWSGQGPVYVAARDTSGLPKKQRLINSCLVEAALSQTVTDHYESDTGNRLPDGRLATQKKMEITLTTDYWDIENLSLGLYSTSAVIAGSTVTGEVLANPLALGDYARLKQQDVSSVQIKDSAGTPATLVAGTDYQVESAKHGRIKIIGDISTYTQPLVADYTYAGGTNVAIFDTPPQELFLSVDVINTAVSGFPSTLAEFYRVWLDPIGSLAVKNDAYGQLVMKGSVLYDPLHAADATLGQFGRLIQMA